MPATTKAYASLACGTPVVLVGPSPLAAAVAADGLGWAVPHDRAAVATAMLAALDAPAPRSRAQRLARWARDHASAQQVSADTAEAVLSFVPDLRAAAVR
jgi:glycosyltransferase involved in cell wall biosynthesis